MNPIESSIYAQSRQKSVNPPFKLCVGYLYFNYAYVQTIHLINIVLEKEKDSSRNKFFHLVFVKKI